MLKLTKKLKKASNIYFTVYYVEVQQRMEEKSGLWLLGLVLCVFGTIALFQGNVVAFLFLDGLGLSFVAVGLGKEAVEDLFDMFKDIFESVFNR